LESSGVYSSTSWGERLSRKTITVINRSNVVGKPLAALLVSEGATVFSVDPAGAAQVLKQRIGRGGRRYQVTDLPGCDLEACLRVSDVILSGVYDRSFQIPTELVKVGAACVDFSSVENFEKSTITLRASMYAYSIGQVVVAALFENFTVSSEIQAHRRDPDMSQRLLLNKERLGCRCKDDLCRWALAAGGSDNDVRFSGRDENVTECCASRPGEQEQTG
jgi:methylenetetrahydrofolate dehydrogenase (NAD+)